MPTYTEQDEMTVLQAYASQGDPRAFEALVLRYQAMVYATCRRQLGNTTDAEDATQETFLKLARKAGAIRTSLAAWLHACAVGTSKDLIRRHATRRKHEQAAGQAPVEQAGDSWETLGPLVDEAMQALPKDQRDLLVERFLMGVAQTEIAEREGVSPSAIHQRVNRAVETLRKKLARKGIPVAAVALGTAMAQATHAAVPQTVTASAMKIGLAGVTPEPAGSIFQTLIEQFMEASLMTKLTATAAALTLIAGSTVTVNQLRSASPPASPATPPTAPAVTPMATDPAKMLEGTWVNRAWKMDNQPATSADIEGRHFRLRVPSPIPGGDPLQMTLEISETDPDASPPMMVYTVTQANSPMIPVTGDPVVASYEVKDDHMKFAIDYTGGPRPENFDQAPGRWVMAFYKEPGQTDPAIDEGLDPDLAGSWTGFLPLTLEIKDGVSYIKGENGVTLSESEIVHFDPKARPMRLEVVATMSVELPELVGQRVKYLVKLDGDRVTYANYEIRSPKQGQWPRDFKGRKGDQLSTTVWQKVDEE